MEKLPESLVKNTYTYILKKRNEVAAIYEQRDPSFSGQRVIALEVFRIKKRLEPQKLPGGAIMQPGEMFPSNADFGKTAWVVKKIETAERIFNQITEKINASN